MLLYSNAGVFPSKDIDEPLFVAGQSLTNVEIDDFEKYANAKILNTAEVTYIEIERSTSVTIDDLIGYETIAKAKDKTSGRPMVIYQVMLFELKSHFLIQGLVSHKNSPGALLLFKEMARTFKRKK